MPIDPLKKLFFKFILRKIVLMKLLYRQIFIKEAIPTLSIYFLHKFSFCSFVNISPQYGWLSNKSEESQMRWCFGVSLINSPFVLIIILWIIIKHGKLDQGIVQNEFRKLKHLQSWYNTLGSALKRPLL